LNLNRSRFEISMSASLPQAQYSQWGLSFWKLQVSFLCFLCLENPLPFPGKRMQSIWSRLSGELKGVVIWLENVKKNDIEFLKRRVPKFFVLIMGAWSIIRGHQTIWQSLQSQERRLSRNKKSEESPLKIARRFFSPFFWSNRFAFTSVW